MKILVRKIKDIFLTPFILKDFFYFKNKMNSSDKRFKLLFKNIYPRVGDRTFATNFDRHYVYHTAWAMRKVLSLRPEKHVDISSSLYFSAMLSAVVPVDFYDYRPANIELPGLKSLSADILKLPFSDDSLESLSCMHVVEHVGLGRYGDPIDPDSDLRAINELKRILVIGGSLLFVVPIGQPKIMFNAHRIYSYNQIRKYFADMELKEFSLIPENGGNMICNATPEQSDKETYGCGCFWFVKK